LNSTDSPGPANPGLLSVALVPQTPLHHGEAFVLQMMHVHRRTRSGLDGSFALEPDTANAPDPAGEHQALAGAVVDGVGQTLAGETGQGTLLLCGGLSLTPCQANAVRVGHYLTLCQVNSRLATRPPDGASAKPHCG